MSFDIMMMVSGLRLVLQRLDSVPYNCNRTNLYTHIHMSMHLLLIGATAECAGASDSSM